jgi:hypothetical protein
MEELMAKNVWDGIDDLLEEVDGHLELVAASLCCWSGELRIGLTNPETRLRGAWCSLPLVAQTQFRSLTDY